MALWVDISTNSHDDTSKQLFILLSKVLRRRNDVFTFLENVPNLDLTEIAEPEELKPGRFWAATVLEIRRQKRLRELIQTAATEFPANEVQFRSFLTIETESSGQTVAAFAGGVTWNRFDDPIDAHFVGPGLRLAMFDRQPVRANLALLRDQGFRTMNIVGDPHSGKTFTLKLVQLMCAQRGWSPAVIDVADWGSSDFTDLDLVTTLASQLRIDVDPKIVDHVPDPQTRARLLCFAFRDQLSPTSEQPLWIVVDGLDRPNLKPEARAFVERLLKSIEEDDKPQHTRLVLTGYAGDLPRTSLSEPLDTVTAADIDRLFEAIADELGPRFDEARRTQWVTDAMNIYAGANDLGALGDSVVERITAFVNGGDG